MNRERAEIIAIRALEWLAGQDDLLGVFLGASGAAPSDLAQMGADPVFLGAVLDFVLLDDAHVLAFCNAMDLPPETPLQARQALPGGAEVSWT